MIWIPFIVFTALAGYIFIKRGIDVTIYILSLYLLTLLAALAIYHFDLDRYDYVAHPVSITPTIVYTLLIALTIWVVYRFDFSHIKSIQIRNPRTIPLLTTIFLGAMLFYLLSKGALLVENLRHGDFAELRSLQNANEGENNVYVGWIGNIALCASIICTFSPIMLPLFFISLLHEKRSKMFYWLMLISSLGSVTIGIAGVDRSKVLYYVLILIMTVIIFWKHLSGRIRRRIAPTLLIGMTLLGIYFYAVTNDRFKDREIGNIGSVLWYAGQSYPFFCYFWEYFPENEEFSTRYLLPATNHFLFNNYKSGLDRQYELYDKTGIFTAVFYTFLGSFLVDCNKTAPFLYVALFILLFTICRVRKKNGDISLFWFMFAWFLAIVPTTGFISYIYNNYSITITIALTMLIIAITERPNNTSKTA